MSGDLIRHVSVNQFLSFYFDGNPPKTEFLPKKTVGPTFSQITHKMRELQRPNVESFFDLKKNKYGSCLKLIWQRSNMNE